MLFMNYVIVGGGVAGVTAAEEIRKQDPQGHVTLLDGEQHALYSRVLLPHYLRGKIEREKVFLKKESWYETQQIDWQRGVFAQEINTEHRFVLTSEGRELPYDKLLLATGGEPRLLDADVRGISYFRTLDDADHLLELTRTASGVKQGVVYGSGFISFEYINFFAHVRYETVVVMRSGGFFSRTLSPASQNVLTAHVAGQGVRLVTDTFIRETIGEKELTGVALENGESLSCSLLGVGIGIEPDRSLFARAGLTMDQGIVANALFETNLPDVFTAGDVAQVMDPIADRPVQTGNWMSALMQGRAVGRIMAGGEKNPFELVSSYATHVLGKEIVMIGDVSREHAESIVVQTDTDNAKECFERDGKTVGAILIGDIRERQKITQAIKDRTRYVG